MLHPHTALNFINEEVGFGVFATQLIRKGTILWTLCLLDRTFTYEQFATLPSAYREMIYPHSYSNYAGKLVFCWDAARYMNHSCHANCLFLGPYFEIAVRDILPGEQITCEYGALNPAEELICQCGSEHCRRIIRSDDILLYGSLWDEMANNALHSIKSVPQPLYPFIQDKAYFESIVSGLKECPSHAVLYYPEASEELQKAIAEKIYL